MFTGIRARRCRLVIRRKNRVGNQPGLMRRDITSIGKKDNWRWKSVGWGEAGELQFMLKIVSLHPETNKMIA